jgi:hypothetical protein
LETLTMLRVIGKLRFIESRPYDFTAEDGGHVAGVAHTARVEQARGRFEDVKVRDEHRSTLPADSAIPDEGVPIDWDVEVRRGKVQFYAPHQDSAPGLHVARPTGTDK